ncbi:unnamed protein product [Adineta ricciae]|uniref:Methyltransferase type 11 domain-containing protein n=1 Tax=Adineta ricciae TaxID=249248 RepID=A0A815R288_ADIRI|nr:unnamed protein product [Adineta ricciae]CAF1469598.1 unnamed protein product [Adineta ricciae]
MEKNQSAIRNGVLEGFDNIALIQPDLPEFQFMNYGFADLGVKKISKITETCENLYKQTLSNKPLEGKDILEVSCGRGGGAAWCIRTFKPRFYVGVDISPNAIALCQQKHAELPGSAFVVSNATKILPFTNESFDFVLSVEATHAYMSAENINRFAREAARILRPNGCLLWCDLCSKGEDIPSINCFTDTGEFIVKDKVDITKNVLQSLDIRSEEAERVIKHVIAPENSEAFRTFSGLPGTAIYEDMREECTVYWRAVFRKKPNPTIANGTN